MRQSLAFAVSILGLTLHAQSGPAGVGTGATNVLWLSADAGVTTIGTAITAWNDLSGNGNNATPAAVVARPTLTAAGLNGKPVVSFDGVNDELRIPDAASLDLLQWDVFMVGADPAPKTNNSWFAKGTSVQPNYGLWSTNTDAVAMPIYDILGGFGAPTSPASTTGSSYALIEYSNTLVLVVLTSRSMNRNGTNVYNDFGVLNLPAVNNNQLYIGNVQGTVGWNLNGSIPEIIGYNTPVNSAQRIIINNYLAGKYGLTLGANNVYVQDDPANGDYDHEIAGIGRINSSNLHNDAKGPGAVRINNPTGLGNNEFLMWGHDNGTLGSWGSTDVPVGVDRRWHRVWRVSELSPSGAAVDVGSVDMTFDLNGQGPVTPSDLRLLVDLNNNGVFADDATVGIAATAVGGGNYRFAGVSQLVNGRRFTLGTINYVQTPLPVELLFFTAEATRSAVNIAWATATEQQNERFLVERSADGTAWDEVIEVPGAGYSQSRVDYTTVDADPLVGLSFYRLLQIDNDGSSTATPAVPVLFYRFDDIILQPNPASDHVYIALPGVHDALEVELVNIAGQVCEHRSIPMGSTGIVFDTSDLPSGPYLIRVRTDSLRLIERLLIGH